MPKKGNTINIFPDVQEFSLIESLFRPGRFSRDARLLGDDGQIIQIGKELWSVSSDASVENTHFRLTWCTPAQALEKALLANMSDINAMGGQCSHLYLNMGIPKSWKVMDFKILGRSISKMEKKYQFQVGGGDITRTAGPCFFSITAMGKITGAPLLRSNVFPGQKIYVSGFLGDASAGLQILSKKGSLSPKKKNFSQKELRKHQTYLIQRFHNPFLNFELGPSLSRFRKKIAAIDISDGLSSELWHLSRQSRCKLVIDPDSLPCSRHLSILFNKSSRLSHMLHGGETYNLLFSGSLNDEELNSLHQYGRVYEIGTALPGEGVYVSIGGKNRILKPEGWSH